MATGFRIDGILVALATLTLVGCDDGGASPPANSAVELRLQQVLDASVVQTDDPIPGAIACVHDPAHRAWSGAAGLGEIPTGTAMRADDRFRAGSILKTFISTVVLQQVEEGKLSLDATLPALVNADTAAQIAGADQITLRMLLNHTSGIPEWVTEEVQARILADPSHVWTPDECIAIAAAQAPSFPPGTSWAYSNTDYTLVGLALDAAGGGKSWRAQVRERVIDRLGLHATSLPEPGDTALPSPYAHGYQPAGGTVLDTSNIDPSMAGAAGGHALVTTVGDLATFIEALLAGDLFAKPETLALMTTMVDATSPAGLPYRYGLGIEQYTLPNGTVIVGHSGSTGGYASMMYRIPALGTTLVTSVNTTDLFANALEVYIPAVDALTAP
jgi:D-alanyl-D-alanine carboxypeptidase